jgi:hypothetical protein
MSEGEKRMEEYLTKAQEAEGMAARLVEGSSEKESWLRIAFAYRDLARSRGYKDPSNA